MESVLKSKIFPGLKSTFDVLLTSKKSRVVLSSSDIDGHSNTKTKLGYRGRTVLISQVEAQMVLIQWKT